MGTGTVLAVCAAGQDVVLDGIGPSAIDKRPLTGRAEVHELGLAADHVRDKKHHGGVDQAVYAYAEPDARRWAGELGRELPYGWFGENLRIDGIDVTDALVGERWQVGDDGLVLETTIPRVPCRTFAVWAGEPRWVKRFMDQADFGAYLRVLQPGTVAAGDSVTVVHRPDHGVRVRHLLAHGDPEAIRALLEHDDLPAKVRREAQRVVTRTDRSRGVARQGVAHKS
ncbi:MOSC domain-containing protein [Gordonia westfalica]|uniref:MOSC domain-containing protein YiiM n=1 Tax=Gordonia westfalica TaxID=158898 RepID=A0A1H2K2F4_9ACTN|nr:MOSC domain-containing protein [Gordonia westfalica]SDU62904.1 MOSC domain-containing protein YiiM [Gordonia westfalica]